MSLPKGRTNNPNGRPPKERALTALLEAAGSATTTDAEGKRVSGKRLVAALAWELATTGKVTLPSGRIMTADMTEWLTAVKWLYGQVDGPPKQAMEHSGPDGEALNFTIRIDRGGDGDPGD